MTTKSAPLLLSNYKYEVDVKTWSSEEPNTLNFSESG